MPTYAYRCDDCGAVFEQVETMTEHTITRPRCPMCGSGRVVYKPAPFMAKTSRKS